MGLNFSIKTLLVSSTYCFLHFLQVMQYMRHVILVLQGFTSCVAELVIVSPVLSLGQYLQCFLEMHWFRNVLVVFILVLDCLLVVLYQISF